MNWTVSGPSAGKGQLWTALWRLKVVPKMRVFWWRALNRLLPDECNLERRHISNSSQCRICCATDEDLLHALMLCSHAKLFWEEARKWFGFRIPKLHPMTWDRDITCDKQFSDDERAKFVTVMWAIWHSRNRRTHDGDQVSPEVSIRRIKEDLSLLELPRPLVSVLPGHGWRPPEQGCIKINTDGAISFQSGKGGARGVARSDSRFLGAWCKPYVGISDSLIMESISMRDGVVCAKLGGFTEVIMETDCLELVNLWSARNTSRSVIAPILKEIEELSVSFTSFDICHVPRAANVPAHLCAKQACSQIVSEGWFECEPPFLVSSLLADCKMTLVAE